DRRAANLSAHLGAQESSADDLRLNLGGSFEDAENARVAKDATDLELERVAVAAMNLDRRIRVAPCDSRGQQLGHARLDIATLAVILRARRRVRQLTSHRCFDDHQRELVGHARELDERTAELLAIVCVAPPEVERAPRNASGARRRLNTRAFER